MKTRNTTFPNMTHTAFAMKIAADTALYLPCSAETANSGQKSRFSEASSPQTVKGSFCFFGSKAPESFFYSDSYFLHSGFDSDPHLRTMSAVLAFASSNLKKNNGNVLQVLQSAGFDMNSVKTDDMELTTPHSIGTVMACKKLNDTCLVAVAVRGDRYHHEWGSNMLAGKHGDAVGFSAAAKTIAQRIQHYLSENHIARVKIWAAGYSRAGAVVNLVGKYINRDPSLFGTSPEDLYFYTFEAPNSSGTDTVYRNIHNIVSPCDLVTQVFPRQWNLHLNGVKEFIGKDEHIVTWQLSDRTATLAEPYQTVSKRAFVHNLMAYIGYSVSREIYAERLEQIVSTALTIIMGKPDLQKARIFSFFAKVFHALYEDSSFKTILSKTYFSADSDECSSPLSSLICSHFDLLKQQTRVPLTEYETDVIKNCIAAIVGVFSDATNSVGQENHAGPVHAFFFLSLFFNFKNLVAAHGIGLIFSELKATDSLYQ